MSPKNSSFNPLVSIVIPVYNGADFLREAIDSALAQTYPNIEVLVINDGSSDAGRTKEIALSYGKRIRYFEKDNGGCATALNYGIDNMLGQYFSWLSHDDKYCPEKVEKQVQCLDSLSDKKTIIYSGYKVIDKNSKVLYSVCPDRVLTSDKLNAGLLPLLRGLIHGCTLLIPAELFDEIGHFDANLLSTQDYALWFDFFRKCPIHFQDDLFVLSRVHPNQGTHKIVSHVEECDELWSSFLLKLSESEMVEMEGSAYLFMMRTAEFLEGTPYAKAAKIARAMAKKMMQSIKVSVIIPFFNRINWTIDAIRSVQKQTHENFEILLIDDGSTENLNSLREFIASDPRINLFQQSNSGVASARNHGIKMATGSYIAFLDSDDLFFPDKIATQLLYMETYQVFVSHTSYSRVNQDLKLLTVISSKDFSGSVFPRIIASCPIAMPTVMAKTEVLKQNIFPEYLHIGEDVCLWITLASKYEWGAIEKSLSMVRVCASSAAFDPKKQCLGLVGIAYFSLADPNLSLHHAQIKTLLKVAQTYLSENVELVESSRESDGLLGKVIPPTLKRRRVNDALWVKFFYSLKHDGFWMTLQRIKKYLNY